MVTRSSLDAARTVEQAAQARFDNGHETGTATGPTTECAIQFDLEASLGAETDARVALIESIELLPNVSLKVADLRRQESH
jgi:hypothetical protein